MLAEDYADMVERLGFRRPELPVGVEHVKALRLTKVTALADGDPEVARVLHLVELTIRRPVTPSSYSPAVPLIETGVLGLPARSVAVTS